MTRPALLDNVAHRHLRLHTGRSAALGDARPFSLALPAEFRQLQAHFPIVFQRVDGDAGFQPIALLGLEEGQNLFLTERGWDAPVMPMAMQRDPFLIGRQGDALQLHIDLDSPRLVGPEEGDVGTALFMPHGGHSEYLDHVVNLMEHLHAHAQRLPLFIDALTRHQLLEPFVLDIQRPDGEPGQLELTLAPDLSAFTYTGEERVTVRVSEPVGEILLNAHEDIEIQEAVLTNAAGDRLTGTVTNVPEEERARIALSGTAAPGAWTLDLTFTGILNDKLAGFYRSTYTDADGNPANGATHAEREIERSQKARTRFAQRKLAVADHAANKETGAERGDGPLHLHFLCV